MMEAADFSETLVNFCQFSCHLPEYGNLQYVNIVLCRLL